MHSSARWDADCTVQGLPSMVTLGRVVRLDPVTRSRKPPVTGAPWLEDSTSTLDTVGAAYEKDGTLELGAAADMLL